MYGVKQRHALRRNQGVPPLPPVDVPALAGAGFHGVLVEQSGPQAAYWRDGGGVEEFLLAEARERGFGKILDALGVRAKSPQ